MIKKNPFADSGSSALPVGLTDEADRKLSTFPSSKVALLTLATLGALYEATVQGKQSSAQHVSVTLTLDTSAYTSGDVLADTQEIPGAVPDSGGAVFLDSLTVLDKDDQTAADMDFVILRSNVALGTENAAPSITDGNAAEVLGIVNVPSANFVDVGGAKIATVKNIRLLVEPTTGTSLFFAVITRGTPTQTATGIVANFGFARA